MSSPYVPPYTTVPSARASSPMFTAQQVYTPASNLGDQARAMMQGGVNTINEGVDKAMAHTKRSGVWNLIILIVIITIVYMILFWLLKVPIVLNTNAAGALTADVSFWKLLITSFVGALLTVLVIWGISKLTGRK